MEKRDQGIGQIEWEKLKSSFLDKFFSSRAKGG